MTFASKLYVGTVSHHRFRPVSHRLRYRMFWLLVDLDEIDALARRLKWFSHNRFNLVSFFDTDHGTGEPIPLRAYVESALNGAGIEPDGGAIRLFCTPRIFGYGFNPLSVFFCHRRNGDLAAILYEVHNTFGQRHSYLIPVAEGGPVPLRHDTDKRFYVSPFMDMEMRYAFRLSPPGDRVALAIKGSDETGPIITAALGGKCRPLSDGGLLRVLLTHPLLTLKVISAIHWHALRLWQKGVKLRPRPPQPDSPITIVPSNR